MKEQKHHRDWEQQWLEGEISAKEAAKNAAADSFDAFEQFIEGAKQLDVPKGLSKEKAWQALENKISSQEKSTKIIPISGRNWVIGIAASFILALGAFFLLPSANHTTVANQSFTTGLAEIQEVYLPDSSIVRLNALSSVSFSTASWEEERVLMLEGEGFFEVKKGSKFSVKTASGIVTVLGTSFNVRERDGSLEVACKTGKVSVAKIESEQAIAITPGEMVSIRDGEITEIEKVNTSRVAAWLNKEFDFESMPLAAVFKELERQYDISIESEFDQTMLEEPLTATLPTDNLENAIQTLELIKGFKAVVSEDGRSITFKRK